MIVKTPGELPKSSKGFIVLEGVNGAGKTTLLEKISTFITNSNGRVVKTREPGSDSAVGKAVRKLLLDKSVKLTPIAELLLFEADRAQHVKEIITPALVEGSFVISDRFCYSTTAFQGYGRGLSFETISILNTLAVQEVTPDLVFLLDLAPEVGLARRKEEKDSIESEALEFHQKIREGFLAIAKESTTPFVLIDATLSSDEIFKITKPYVEHVISSRS